MIYRLYEGNYVISTDSKYKALIGIITVVHLCFIVFFSALGVRPLVIFNIFSVIMYLYLRVMIGKRKYVQVYMFTYFEIFLHTVIATVLVGWNLGFPLYNLAIVPVSFYISYMTPGFKREIIYPTILAGINMTITILGRLYDYEFGAIYRVESEAAVFAFHTFNSIIAYTTVGVFSFLFLVELRAKQVDLMRKNRELDQLAGLDSLTGLYNRRSIESRIRDVMSEDRDFCITIGDIDGFKKINDTYGHSCGDKVLQNIAGVLCDVIGHRGLVCRWGGEEFLIVLFMDLETACNLMEIVKDRVEVSRVDFQQRQVACSMTFGICECVEGQDYEDMIRRADEMLCKGKQEGKNCVVY